MSRNSRFIFLFYFMYAGCCLAQATKTYTSSEIYLQLKKLNTVGSVLYIAAHPDDENTRLLAWLANEKCLRTGYLSLTRGDGGQNLIGPEQGIELGVIRTQELLAARRIDGAEQFFTRAIDFGYSKTDKETFSKWNHDSVLADVVWVIRRFRPDVIITRFPTDGNGGHGHHTASAILAEEAFDAAGDSTRFPSQLFFVSTWKPKRLYYNSAARFSNPNADMSSFLKVNVGGYNALLGKSYGEIAAESRSMHKSQGFGSARQRGDYFEYFKPLQGDTSNLKSPFEGLDYSWKRFGDSTMKIQDAITSTMNAYDFNNPSLSFQKIIAIRDILAKARSYYRTSDQMLREHYGTTLILKSELCDKLLEWSSGIFSDYYATEYSVCPGDSIQAIHTIINRSSPEFDLDWRMSSGIGMKDKLIPNVIHADTGYMHVSTFFTPSIPQYLTYKPEQNMLVIPFQPDRDQPQIIRSKINTYYQLSSGSIAFYTTNYLQYKTVDPSRGEIYRPVVVTPPIMINLREEVMLFPDNATREMKFILKAGKDSVSGNLSMVAPKNWNISCKEGGVIDAKSFLQGDTLNVMTNCEFSLLKKGEEKEIKISITPPVVSSEAVLQFKALYKNEYYSKGIKEIKYEHIPVQTLFPEAQIKLVRIDIKHKLKTIAYIAGAGDEMQQCLKQVGYQVTSLSNEMLAREDLQKYEAIIFGIRAYNVNEKLPGFRKKFLDYMQAGGNIIVQYNTNSFAGPLNSEIGPYPFKITRDRVTDETAEVKFDIPSHPVLNIPNKITSKDFEGWIQERCIYSASDSTGKYEMPLSMSDPGEKPNKGSLIITKYGKGNFIYTGLVFFREMPAGVPGAYRLFVNLMEAGKW